jgi:hypothetical protein
MRFGIQPVLGSDRLKPELQHTAAFESTPHGLASSFFQFSYSFSTCSRSHRSR